MGFGPQVNSGQASRIFFQGFGSQGNPVAPTAVDSEGIALQKMRQPLEERALDIKVQGDTADRNFQAAQRDADRNNALQQTMAPINFKRDVFNQVSPLLTGLMGQQNENGVVGGASAIAPDITRGPIWSGQQIQEQVNAGKSANAANADTQTRSNERRMAGSGFGSRSPLLAALNSSVGMQRAGADADVDRNTRWGAAQGNADSTFRTDQLATQQWSEAQNQDIARRQARNQYTSSLASVLASLV